jgi:hypothetical protein
VIAAGRPVLEHEPVEMSGIEPMHGGPAVEPVTHVGRDALLARQADEQGDKGVISIAMDRGG